jgi:hypothetical protein
MKVMISKMPAKPTIRRALFEFAVRVLQDDGYDVAHVSGGMDSSVRSITKAGVSHRVAIRTSQDDLIAFRPKHDGDGWVTLDDVEFVVVATVNDANNPTEARLHLIPAEEARDRWNRAYRARRGAGHDLADGRSVWLSLYDQEAASPETLVGAGMGLAHPAFVRGLAATFDVPKSTITIEFTPERAR